MIDLQRFKIDYEPYPVGVQSPAFDPVFYAKLVDTFPSPNLFAVPNKHATKLSLSEKNNPGNYEKFIQSTPAWREVHAYIKSDAFIHGVIEMLRSRGIDLDFMWAPKVRKRRKWRLFGSDDKGPEKPLSSRFEFSILKANGGGLAAHTDSAKKFITLVFTMTREGEWNREWGGGTDILKTTDPAKSFNFVNNTIPYEETQTLRTVEFNPNQAMIFVKTFNSLHGVKTMHGPENALRRTLTVNIERAFD